MPQNPTLKGVTDGGAYSYVDETGLEYYVDPNDAVDWGLPLPDGQDFSAPTAAQTMAPAPEPMPDMRTADLGGYQLDEMQAPQVAPEVEAAIRGGAPQGQQPQARPDVASNAHQVAQPQPYNPLGGSSVVTADQFQPQAPPGQEGAQPQLTPEEAAIASQINQAVPIDAQPRVTRFGARPAQWTDEARVTEGPDQKRLQQRMAAVDKLEDQKLAVAGAKAESQLAQAQAERDARLTQAMRMQTEMDDLRSELQKKEERYKQEWQRIDEQEQEVAKQTADPDRLFKENPIGRILAAVAVGMGQFGSSLTGSRNTALDIIKDRIQSDVAQQQAEIASDKDAIAKEKNAFARELANGEDPRFVRDKLEYMQARFAQNALEAQAAQARDEQTRLEYLDAALGVKEWAEEKRAALDDKVRVKITESFDPGRAGGVSVETPQQMLARLKATQGVRDVLRGEAGIPGQSSEVITAGEKAAAVGRAKAETAAAKKDQKPTDVRKFEDTSDALLQGISEIVADAGGKINPETGEIEGVGAGFTFNPLYETEARTRFNARARAIGTGYANAIVNLGAELGEGAKEKLIPSGDLEENTEAKLEAMYKDILARKNSLQQKYGDRSSAEIEELE